MSAAESSFLSRSSVLYEKARLVPGYAQHGHRCTESFSDGHRACAYAEVQALAGRPGRGGVEHRIQGAYGIDHSENAGGERNCTLLPFLSLRVPWYWPEQVKNSW
ncbi:hypothetical protein ABZ622_08635 [Streptomyces sp. NPDC007164]|uniref:hypothetical protein n=1 Tax=Streptomyces sp. NPDC007164 TaxID=3156918 RepID=UPI0033D7EBFE